VFVIGAGAGHEFGMPLGSALAAKIADLLRLQASDGISRRKGDAQIWDALRDHVQRCKNAGTPIDPAALQRAASEISAGIQTADSIDDFLDRAKTRNNASEIILCGKVAIARAILDAESRSSLRIESDNIYKPLNLNSIAGTWMMKLLRMLLRNHPEPANLFENVAFINFNYDRCLEHFLLSALQVGLGCSAQDSIDLVRGARIYHPYGVAGELPTLGRGNAPRVSFGGDGSNYLVQIAEHIRTYTEQIADQSLVQQLQHEIANTEVLVFLGFAYHKPNMDIITPSDPSTEMKRIFGTALNFSEHDARVIRRYLLRFYAENRQALVREDIHLNIRRDLSCEELFNEYGRTLANA
jgi:hypothetical protein